MPLSNVVRVSRHITYVGKGDFNTKGKCTIDKLSTAAAFQLNHLTASAVRNLSFSFALKSPLGIHLM
ncbi:hypothetical protein T11_17141 [Trichinella zimbabwensis]|uniref:Uncharacterized protein n=1 Tax=Trichinella zimbabwensis TaxID=268475 RepID=A0A0V1H3C6_9BILA|nr:hypothetical protein T11_17141 [Trichinella zimbabwensis]